MVLAALINALKLVGKPMSDIKVVVSGVGAAGVACTKIIMAAGVRNIVGCDRSGIVYQGREKMDWLQRMASRPVVFAMANPTPEIMPEEAAPYVAIMATGRSDYPNQINNVLCFPGIFRGALDARASQINEEMKLAAAHAIAGTITADELGSEYIVPSVFDKRVSDAVAQAVAAAAHRTGVARRLRER